jgi:HD superfamily phosphohydrolase
MHLASRFLAAVRRNSSSDVEASVTRGLLRYGRRRGVTQREVERWASYINSDALIAGRGGRDDGRHWWIIAEQALRLAAFFHDLGHLAFSHDFEFALKDYWSSLSPTTGLRSPVRSIFEDPDEPPHELIGHRLAPMVLALVGATHRVDQPGAFQLVFEMAQAILEADFESPRDPADAVMRLLHLLIDGEIDADRCDYILRDARGFGFDFAGYDLDRLLDNLVIVTRRPEDAGRPPLDVAIRPQGVAAAESFFIARYRSYQYNMRHHKVAQVGAALRYSIKRLLLTPPKPLQTEVAKLLQLFGSVADQTKSRGLQATRDLLGAFAMHDDMSWMTLMRRAYELTPTDPWLALLCWRQPTVNSLWKRRSAFPVDDLRKWNQALDSKGDIERERAWDNSVRLLETRGVLVLRHKFSAIGTTTYGEDLLQVVEEGSLTDLSTISSLVPQLKDAWMGDVQIHAAQAVRGNMSAKQVVAALSFS